MTDWPGLDQLWCHLCFKVSGPSRLGWAGLAGRFLPSVRALSFCIVLPWIQQRGFLRLLLSRRPWPFLCSSFCGLVERSGRREKEVQQSGTGDAATVPVFIPHTKGRRCCSRDSAFLADGMKLREWKPTRTPAPALRSHLIHVLLSTRVAYEQFRVGPCRGTSELLACAFSSTHGCRASLDTLNHRAGARMPNTLNLKTQILEKRYWKP